MQRGMKLFGWACIVGGCAVLGANLTGQIGHMRLLDCAYAVMGLFFGGLHLAYGIYLYFTEQRRNAA